MSDSTTGHDRDGKANSSADALAATTPGAVPEAVRPELDKTVSADRVESVAEGAQERTVQLKNPAADAKQKVSRIGDFKVIRKLGQGGMGEVFLARQISLDRAVALKTLSKQLSKRETSVKRFIREARAMAKIDHPNAVRVYAVESQKGLHYAAIEYIDGQSMQDWMNELGRLSVGDALHVILRCADALRHAHDLRIIHRDIKPDNILLTQSGAVKLADFGLAKVIDEDMSMTQSGTGMGTPLYMAPEQARNAKHVDSRSDIYALGVTLYHFLTGSLPFSGETTLDLLLAKEAGKFAPARQINSDVPERLDLILDKMLAKTPEHRYDGCEQVIRDLRALSLESERLSFVSTDTQAAAPPSAAAFPAVASASPFTAKSVTQPPAGKRGRGKSETRVAQTGEATAAGLPTEAKWFVRYTNARGRITIANMTTSQILKGIKAEMLDLKAKARKTAKGQFVPLSQFPEFEGAMKNRLIKAQADARSTNMKEMYAQIDKQERRRHRWRWLKGKFEGVLGMFSLLIVIALIAACAYGVWVGLPLLYEFIAERYHLT